LKHQKIKSSKGKYDINGRFQCVRWHYETIRGEHGEIFKIKVKEMTFWIGLQ
jgi:hypothetical protein